MDCTTPRQQQNVIMAKNENEETLKESSRDGQRNGANDEKDDVGIMDCSNITLEAPLSLLGT